MKKKASFKDLINNDKPVLIDFYADWCGPCKAMNPILKEVAQKMENKARIVKINVDKNPAVAEQYKIQGIPTFLIFQNGNLKWRQSGMVSAHHLETTINQIIESKN